MLRILGVALRVVEKGVALRVGEKGVALRVGENSASSIIPLAAPVFFNEAVNH